MLPSFVKSQKERKALKIKDLDRGHHPIKEIIWGPKTEWRNWAYVRVNK